MNKSDLIAAVATATEQTKADVGRILEALIATITTAIAEGGTVTLAGFGTFKAVHREARQGRNPTTGVPMIIAAATQPKFSPGTVFKAVVAESATHKGKRPVKAASATAARRASV